jgi:hypothetical protein
MTNQPDQPDQPAVSPLRRRMLEDMTMRGLTGKERCTSSLAWCPLFVPANLKAAGPVSANSGNPK